MKTTTIRFRAPVAMKQRLDELARQSDVAGLGIKTDLSQIARAALEKGLTQMESQLQKAQSHSAR